MYKKTKEKSSENIYRSTLRKYIYMHVRKYVRFHHLVAAPPSETYISIFHFTKESFPQALLTF